MGDAQDPASPQPLCQGVSETGDVVGGKMVHYMTCLWRLVSAIGIHHYHRRMRIPSGSLYDPPMETSFGHWNTSLSSQDENPIIGRICAGNLNIRFFRCLPNRDVISS